MNENFTTLLDKAYKMHTSGNLSDAAVIYEKLLALSPENAEVLNLYAQLNVSNKNYDKALELFFKVYELTKIDDIKINIAKVFIYKKDYEKSEEVLKSICQKNTESIHLLAFVEMQRKNYEAAIGYYNSLIEINPNNYAAYYNISLCFDNLNKIDEALQYALKALNYNEKDTEILLHCAHLYERLNDREKELYYLLKFSDFVQNENILYRIGVLYKHLDKFHEAVSYFEKVIHLNPDNKDAMLNIASTYKNIDKTTAVQIYNDIYQIFPEDYNIIFQIYALQIDMLDFSGALDSALKLINFEPDNSMYYQMAADSYLDLYEYEKAVEYYNLALKYNPDDENAKCSLAYILSCHNYSDEAMNILKNLQRTRAVIQDYTILNLRIRNFEEVADYYYNWHTEIYSKNQAEEKARKYFYKLNVREKYDITEEYFAKFRAQLPADTIKKLVHYKEKLMNREDFSGKSILVYSGHGAGDLIMFVRYLKILQQKAKHVILSVPDSLLSLMQYNFPEIEVLSRKIFVEDDKYDYSMPEMGLIYNLKLDFINIPYPDKYLDVSDEYVEEKSKLKILNTNKKKIGIFWQGNPTTLRNRSVKLRYFLPLLENSAIQYYSFQISKVDFESHDLKQELPLVDLSSYIKDYTDTAALLKNMDLLITIDTSIAHLAGAMGIKTFLMLPYDSEWRWFYNEETTPWYNSIRIFKQTTPNNWEDVISKIKDEVGKL